MHNSRLLATSWPKSQQVTTREVHANAPWGRDEELALGEGGAEGITWKTAPGSEAWNVYGICMEHECNMHGICMEHAWNKYGICMGYAWIL